MSEDLDRIIAYFDALREWAMQATRPAYAEVCSCGASVEVSKDVPPADRRRIANNFSGVHRGCTDSRIRPEEARHESWCNGSSGCGSSGCEEARMTWREVALLYPTTVQWYAQCFGPLPDGPITEGAWVKFRALAQACTCGHANGDHHQFGGNCLEPGCECDDFTDPSTAKGA